jgi:hypothetical protein
VSDLLPALALDRSAEVELATEDEVALVGATFSSLSAPALQLMTRRLPDPVSHYLSLRAEAFECDIASDAGAAFQRKFNGFYGVRRNARWRAEFYGLFEEAKGSQAAPGELFSLVLERIYVATGRVEASFASKLVATLFPAAPIIDSVVRGFLGARVKSPLFAGGLHAPRGYHLWLEDFLTRLAETPAALIWMSQFDAAFAECAGASEIHPVKKIDFLIWGGARG